MTTNNLQTVDLSQSIDLVAIRQKATDLLIKSGLIGQYPLPLDKLAACLGYKVQLFEPSNEISKVSGTVSKSQKTILLNAKEPYTRKRFTLAHEIAHVCLHFSNNDDEFIDYNRSTERSLKEDEADEFAACLLMPEEVFIAQWARTNGNFDQLANYFGVSQAAVGMRTYRLGLE